MAGNPNGANMPCTRTLVHVVQKRPRGGELLMTYNAEERHFTGGLETLPRLLPPRFEGACTLETKARSGCLSRERRRENILLVTRPVVSRAHIS